MTSLPADAYRDMSAEHRIDRRVIARCGVYLRGPRILCMGYTGDAWPEEAVAKGFSVDIVEGLPEHVDFARTRFAQLAAVRIFQSTFEQFFPFDAPDEEATPTRAGGGGAGGITPLSLAVS